MNFKKKIRLVQTILFVIFVSSCISTGTNEEKEKLINDIKATQIQTINEGWSSIYNNYFTVALTKINETLENDKVYDPTLRSSLSRAKGIASYGSYNDYKTFDALYESLVINPTGPYSWVVATFMTDETLWDIERLNKLAKQLNKIVKNKNTPTWLKREYQYILEEYYRSRVGNIKKAIDIREDLNLITDWEIIGPYSNISNSGYNNDYLTISPKSTRGLSEITKGLNNWDVLRFKPAILNRELLIPISSYFNYENYVSIYAYHEFDIKEPSDYEFILSRQGSIEVWINNEKVISKQSDTKSINRTYFSKYLNQGINRILVKSNKLENSTLFNLSYNKVEKSPNYIKGELYKELFPDNEDYDPIIAELCSEFDLDKDNKESLFWLTYALLNKGLEDQANLVLNRVKEINTNSNFYQYFNALLYYVSGDKPLYNNEIIKLAQQEEIFAPIQISAIKNYLSTGRETMAGNFYKKLYNNNPEGFYTQYADLLIANYKKNNQRVIDRYNRLKNDFPGIYIVDNYLIYNKSEITFGEKTEYINNLYSNGAFRKALYLDYINNYNMGEYYSAKDKMEQYLGLFAINESAWVDYINLLFEISSSDFKTISNVLTRTLSTFPTSYDILKIDKEFSKSTFENMQRYMNTNPSLFVFKKKSVKAFIENKELAKNNYSQALKKILKYYPHSLEIRDEERKLLNKKTFQELIEKKDSYTIIDQFKSSNFSHSPADITVVYDSHREVHFGDGSSSEFNHYIIKLNTPYGIESNRFINLGFNPRSKYNHLSEAFTLKEDGTRVEANFSGNEVAFNRVNTGDYIVLSYRKDLYNYGLLNKEIFSNFSLESTSPIFKKEIEVIYPKDKDLNFKYLNIDESEVEKTTEEFENDYTKLSININQKIAKTYPTLSVNSRDFMQSVEITTLQSWDDILNWYKPLYEGQTIPSRIIEKKATELTSGNETQIEKVKSIFNYVANKVEYEDLSFQYDGYIPQRADSILQEGYGDCKDQSVLLISLLKAVGIPSFISLNATYYNGNNPFLPSLVFDHALVGVDLEDETIYLDPTLTFYNFGEMPADRNGTYLLDIKDGGTIHKASYNIENQINTTILELKNIDSLSEINGSRVFQGGNAWGVRARYNNLSLEEKQNIFQDDTNSWLPGFKVDSFNIENIDDIYNPPSIKFSGKIPSLITPVRNNIVKVNTPWFDYLNTNINYWLGVKDDSEKIAIPSSSVSTPKTQIMIIDLPKNYKAYSLPGSYSFKFKNCYINFSAEEESGQIILKRELFIPEQEVNNTDIAEFKKFIENAINAEKEELYLTL